MESEMTELIELLEDIKQALLYIELMLLAIYPTTFFQMFK